MVKLVNATRCLGLVDKLDWSEHLVDVIKSFSRKLNLLKSLYFLPATVLEQFYFKVTLPSITYGIVAWGSCNKTPFQDLEKMHVRAAKIIFKFDWTTPSTEVLSKVNWKRCHDGTNIK